METTLKQRLQSVEFELAKLAPSASAEGAYRRANSSAPNPWLGASERLELLTRERDDILLQLEGQRLSDLLEKQKELENRLEVLIAQRMAADRRLAEFNGNPVVQRYRTAFAVARNENWGHSWSLFANFLSTDLPLRPYAPECSDFFLNDPQAIEKGLRFSVEDEIRDGKTVPSDRRTIHEYNRAVEASNLALQELNDCNSALRELKFLNPELASAT